MASVTWNKRYEKQFLSRLESKLTPDTVKDLGRHLIRGQNLKGIARFNRDPYLVLYSIGQTAIKLQRAIDDAEPEERQNTAEHVFVGFCGHFHDLMKPPPDDDTPYDWYTGVSMAIWAAANGEEFPSNLLPPSAVEPSVAEQIRSSETEEASREMYEERAPGRHERPTPPDDEQLEAKPEVLGALELKAKLDSGELTYAGFQVALQRWKDELPKDV